MRVSINLQSEKELLCIMKMMNITNPSHCMNILVSRAFNRMTDNPQREVINENKDNNEQQN